MPAKSTSNKKDENDLSSFLPVPGERVLSIGFTGTGKTTANRELLKGLPYSPTVIYDTKHDAKFEELPNHRIAYSMLEAEDALGDLGVDYVIIRPPPALTSSPDALDRMLQHHEEQWHEVTAYIDEMYHFHKHGHAGPGLNGLYTRGRSRGITTIASTQRPAWVSGFIFSETNLFYLFGLNRKSDRKRVDDFIDGFADLPVPDLHHFYVYRQGPNEKPRLMPPVKVADAHKLGYTDTVKVNDVAESDTAPVEERPTKAPHIWI